MKSSVGNDLVYLPEFKKSLTSGFKLKVYTDQEIKDCQSYHNPLVRFGSTWAAKESCYKAIKQLFPDLKIWWKSLEIERNRADRIPRLNFLKTLPSIETSLTITHDGDYCWAICFAYVS